jgi:hypothetical protein
MIKPVFGFWFRPVGLVLIHTRGAGPLQRKRPRRGNGARRDRSWDVPPGGNGTMIKPVFRFSDPVEPDGSPKTLPDYSQFARWIGGSAIGNDRPRLRTFAFTTIMERLSQPLR